MRGQSIFKEEPLATNFFQKCFKVETAFPYSGNIFFNIFHPASGNKFCAYWKQYFFGQSYFAASRNHYWNQEKIVLKERAYSCQWTTDFQVCEKHCFCIFHRLLPVIVFYRLVETSFSTKSLVPASANGFSGQQKPLSFVQRFFLLVKPSLKLVETNF